MLKKYKEYIVNLRRIDANIIFQLIFQTITIVALLAAINHFSKKSSIEITVSRIPFAGFHMNGIRDFYTNNTIKIPKTFAKDPNLKILFDENLKNDEEKQFIPVGAGASDFELTQAIKNGRSLGSYINDRIEDLQKQMEKYDYKKRIWVLGEKGRYYDNKSINIFIDRNEKRLSKEELFIFLTALLQSRKLDNHIYIRNNGDIDLQNVKVSISSPISKVYESRKNNILNFSVQSLLPHKIENEEEILSVYLPILKTDDHFSMSIISRENQIKKDEIFYSFEEKQVLNKREMIVIALIILLIMILLRLFFKGKTKNKHRVAS